MLTSEEVRYVVNATVKRPEPTLSCGRGAATYAEELEAFCRQRLATYKVPHQYEFIAELPKGPSGKILKRVLRDQAAAAPVAV